MFVLRIIFSVAVVGAASCLALTYDNQIFHHGRSMHTRTKDRYTYFAVEPFIFFTDGARGDTGKDIGLFEIYGKYDLNEVTKAMQTIGLSNPLRSEWRGNEIQFDVNGRVEAGGVMFLYHQALHDQWSVGATVAVGQVSSWVDFILDRSHVGFTVTDGIADELDSARRTAHRTLGLRDEVERRGGFSDIDAYIRWGNIWHYPRKFRRIDAGVSVGVLIPTGLRRGLCVVPSVPWGGNGHVGLYGAVDAEFELREDLRIGFLARVQKRFARTCDRRAPLDKEPLYAGVLTGQFRVSPGAVLVVSPYLLMQYIRGGLGVRFGYTVVKKWHDCWFDERVDKMFVPKLSRSRALSTWAAEYLSVSLINDFKADEEATLVPTVYGQWDIPVHWLVAQRVAKSHMLRVGIEIPF